MGKYVSRWLAAAVIGLAWFTGVAFADDHVIRNSSYGCKSKDIRSKLTGYTVDGDKEAFRKALLVGVMSGECSLFNEGDHVYLTDTSIFSGLVCVRPRGALDCFWTNIEAVK
ncbi:hypothetical protein [Bradyrhizobium sp. BWC-3-1]|uniref:hypothetical protein n=1 Tax=Bradyrhizobium sp. BWC-3-1 TaxID=3080012 RepID=UPI00293F36DC|nr:hypothetical protein [Bradyrhizobium sp. BWC-3-1]WOH55053.1 hypothetical protein RX329_22265 [Bradyrhizobium sp. BWC-3-1]